MSSERDDDAHDQATHDGPRARGGRGNRTPRSRPASDDDAAPSPPREVAVWRIPTDPPPV